MKLFSDNLKIEQIPETELIQIGFKLKQFVEYYRKYILINDKLSGDKDQRYILNTLEDISHKILTKQYSALFDDIRIIDFTDDGLPF
jgi:hypothetical protein